MISKSLLKNSLFNLLGLGTPLVVAVFAIPRLIHLLGTERFGILTLIWVVVSYASLFDLGLGRAVTQQLSLRLAYADNNGSALVWTALLALSGLGMVGGGVLYFLSPWLVRSILHLKGNLGLDTIHAFYVLALSLPFVIATDSVRGVLESHRAFHVVNTVRIPMGVFTFLGPLLALYAHNSLTMIAYFLAGGKILNFIIYLWACFKLMPSLKEKIYFEKSLVSTLFRIGGWTTVSNIISPLMGYLDRFFIAGISLVALTYYVTPNEMITKLWLIPGAITAVFFPEFARLFVSDTNQLQLLFTQCIKYIFLILFPVAFVAICFANNILSLWLGNDFSEASYRLLQWFALGVLINSLAQVPFSLVQARGDSHLIAKVHLFELPFYVGALWLGSKLGSIEIMAVVWFGRMVIDAILMYILAYRFLPFIFPKNIINLGASVLALFVASYFLQPMILKLGILVIGIALVYNLMWKYHLSYAEKEPILRYCQRFKV